MSNTSGNTECEPLKQLEDVLSWLPQTDWSALTNPLKSTAKYCYDAKNFHCHMKSRNPIKISRANAPKTLVCHDMKGGYIDDRFVEGATYDYQYLFYHWSVIDTFVYFSHHFVTIPPLMWINAAHSHGVEILGTLITEDDAGKKIWDQILAGDDVIESFVSKLADICDHYNFDGYLINVENALDKVQIPKFISFLEKFKSKLGSKKIIWYDAVSLTTGELRWENELNEHNKTAFQKCDGIFLNYNWSDVNLKNSLDHAGARQFDVYVGIDVFGRGTSGDGGFDTNQAMAAARSQALSVAIFGQGWTHETQSSDGNFFTVERKFWYKLWPYLYIHVLDSLPFETTFNQGVSNRVLEAEAESSNTVLWYDLSRQKYHLPIPSCLSLNFETGCTSHNFYDGVHEGCSVSLNYDASETQIHRVLFCDFSCTVEKPSKLTISTKWSDQYSSFKLILWVENEVRNFTIPLLVSKENEQMAADSYDYSSTVELVEQINAEKIIKVGDNGWISNEFKLPFSGQITEIDAQLQNSVLIGSLSLE